MPQIQNKMKTLQLLFNFSFLFILSNFIHNTDAHAEQERNTTSTSLSSVLAIDTDESYYSVIIDNNIFRPLGWRPKKAVFPYQLIATIVYKKRKNPTAIIQNTTSNKTIFVSPGDTFDDMTVIAIRAKQVTLSKLSKEITLNHRFKFLSSSHSTRKPQVHSEVTQKTSLLNTGHPQVNNSPSKKPIYYVPRKKLLRLY
ncbi:hypothetical protein F4X73_10115 [Candidatus Poribacteria bacterium]|nr:hypothetical protein [Candidatus Poribacteria bacterium]